MGQQRGPSAAQIRDRYDITVHFSSNLSFEESAATMRADLADPRVVPGFGFPMGRRAAREVPTTEYIERVIDFMRTTLQLCGCRWATVVRDQATTGWR